jgi:hypothetical protein
VDRRRGRRLEQVLGDNGKALILDSGEYNAKVLAILSMPRQFKAVTMQFTERG